MPESAPASLDDPLDDPEPPGPEPLAPPEEAPPDAEEPVDPEEAPPELVACGAPLADIPLVPPAPAPSPPAPLPEGPEQAPKLPAAARTSHDKTREVGSDEAAFMKDPSRQQWRHNGSSVLVSHAVLGVGCALPTDRHAEPWEGSGGIVVALWSCRSRSRRTGPRLVASQGRLQPPAGRELTPKVVKLWEMRGERRVGSERQPGPSEYASSPTVAGRRGFFGRPSTLAA